MIRSEPLPPFEQRWAAPQIYNTNTASLNPQIADRFGWAASLLAVDGLPVSAPQHGFSSNSWTKHELSLGSRKIERPGGTRDMNLQTIEGSIVEAELNV